MAEAANPTPAMYSEGVDTLKAEQYLNGNWNNTKRSNIILERLDKMNRIKVHTSGKFFSERARIGRYQESQRTRLAQRTAQIENHWIEYAFPVVPHEVVFGMSEEDAVFYSGDDGVDLSKRIIADAGMDFQFHLNKRILQSNADSNTVGGIAQTSDSQAFRGLPSIFGVGSSATGYSRTGGSTGSAAAASDLEVLPNVDYFNISTHPTNAITGVQNKVDESTSPVIANWSSTGWNSTASTTYASNAGDVARHLINRINQRKDAGMMANTRCGIQSVEMHNDFVQFIATNTNSDVALTGEPREPDAGLFPRLYLQYLGVKFYADISSPANWLYILDLSEMAFHVRTAGSVTESGISNTPLKGQLPRYMRIRKGDDFDHGAHKAAIIQYAQLFANPHCQAAAYNFA